jgi:hypothetical protein
MFDRARWMAVVSVLVCAGASASRARAEGLVPGPGEAGFDAALAGKADAFDRQIHALLTLPVGWGLEAEIGDAQKRAAVDAFFASGESDFQKQSGLHPYEVIDRYEEFGDLGMFGGVQAAGDAFRYAVLRDGGAPEAEIAEARAHLVRAMEGLHWYMQVTGEPGVVARGLRRITPEAGEPPLPGEPVETVPLFDASGNPQPADKKPTWRDDRSGELPFLVWLDDTSKDQLDGYVFALGAVYDVVADDPAIPADAVARLVDDARALGARLIQKVELSPGFSSELVIVDADGRPTSFHDLSAEEATPGVLLDAPLNGFNGWMALAILRTLYHVTGDEAVGRFYREELLEKRGYLANVRDTIAIMYTGFNTNYSNVNMAFVAAYGLMRYESDDALAAEMRELLETQLYAPGKDREARGLGQTFFDYVYAAFGAAGSLAGPGAEALAAGTATLVGFPAPPYWNPEVVHCDAQEIASLDCKASDGTALPLARKPGWNGGVVALDPLPIALQPPSNFHWRSDPHAVNGGGGPRLNPGGDFHAAYWMGRMLVRSADGLANRSPRARPLPAPIVAAGPDAPTAAPGDGDDPGCACRAAPARGRAPFALLAGSWLLRRLRRRCASKGAP